MDREVACIPGNNTIPGDIYIHKGPGGVPIAIDVAVVSPLTKLDLRVIHDLSMPARNANEAERRKITKYEADFITLKGRVTFLPFGVSTFGALGSHARSVMEILGDGITHGRLIPPEIAIFYAHRFLIGHVLANIGVSLSQALSML